MLPITLPDFLKELKKKREYKETRIISNEGIFVINNNEIKKLYFEDKETFKISVNNTKFVCDSSIITKKKWNKIPYYHEIQEINIVEYSDYPKFKIIVETDNYNKVKELYFETNDKENLCENINTLYFR